ncbi:hypothetical protein P8X24_07190 [Pyrococcus kukulkanii]|uniref:hypothetical protein n=1 Tax=Pyrococcus kukulkanii TaxID=1609559 RepID=UPI0035664A08
MASPTANLLFTLGSFILGFSLPRLVYEHYKSKVGGSLTAIALSMITLGMLFELQDLWMQASKNMPFSVQSLFWGFFAGNMIALLYYGFIGVGKIGLKAGRLVGRAYHEVKALRKEEKRLEKEEKEELKDLKEIHREMEEARKEFEKRIKKLEEKLNKDLKVEEMDVKEVLSYIEESKRLIQEFMKKYGSILYMLRPNKKRELLKALSKELKEKADKPLESLKEQTEKVLRDIERMVDEMKNVDSDLEKALIKTEEALGNLKAYLKDFETFSGEFERIVKEYDAVEENLLGFEERITHDKHLVETLRKIGRGGGELKEISQELRKIVRESGEAFHQIHTMSRMVNGLKFDESKIERLEKYLEEMRKKNKYSVRLSNAVKKHLEKIRKQLIAFKDVKAVEMANEVYPHKVVEAFGKGVNNAMEIIEESLSDLEREVEEFWRDMDGEFQGLLSALNSVEVELKKLEQWEGHLVRIGDILRRQEEDLEDVRRDISRLEKDLKNEGISNKIISKIDPLKNSIKSLEGISESFKSIEEGIRDLLKKIKNVNIKGELSEINHLRDVAHKILKTLRDLSIREGYRFRKAMLVINQRLRELYSMSQAVERNVARR